MHLAENIHADLYRTNVKVQLINPGFIKTRLTDKNEFAMPFIISAGQAATKVKNAMATNRFQTNFPRLFSSVFLFFRILPSFLYFTAKLVIIAKGGSMARLTDEQQLERLEEAQAKLAARKKAVQARLRSKERKQDNRCR